ncbi:MAG TPA: response regulator [Anaerolineales bacterium]|nr:response regulator [Anaerolineales bacterium]
MDKPKTADNKPAPVRILVVDDHPYTATTLARAIAQLGDGIKVLSATSGKQALEYANNDTVDVLITDMMMPGMTGLELIEQLQANPAGRPLHIILMTAYDVPGLKETTRRLKIHNTIIKPVPTEHICQIVKQVLDSMGHVNVTAGVPEHPHHFKIMIADDAPDNVNLLSRLITNEGYDYIVASNGIEVLQKAQLDMPDLILLDVNMPEKDGFTALKELRADAMIAHIPVIILTAARPSPNDIQWGLNLGADDYVTKPFDRRELLARIRTKLRVKEVEDAIRRRNRELSILPEIAKELSARLDVNELLDVALRRSVETLGAIVGHVITLHPREPLHKEYRISTSGTVPSNLRLPPLNDLVQQIKEKRTSIIIADTREDPCWQPGPDDSTRSVIIVPMAGRLDLLGLFILAHEQPGYFNMEHQLLLQAIASLASIAVENARLYASLIQEEQKFTAVLHNAADAILMFDAEKQLLLANPAGRKLFTDYELKVGQQLPDGLGYDSFLRLLNQIDTSSTSALGEIEWPDKRVFSAILTPLTEGGCVIVLHDVTHFKNLEKVKNEFIATASHDLRNPIASIEGFSRLIEQAGPLNKSQGEFAKRIQNTAESMIELVENMLNLAKMDLGAEPKHEMVNLTHLLSEIADEFQPLAQVKSQLLTLVKSRSGLTVQGDALQLRQALRNLVSNAIKYTPNGGTITLSLECGTNMAKIKIQDTGYGIPLDDLPFIFDRFYRAQHQETKDIQGNGLGLAIVKSIVERHGGQVQVESKPGVGSCFSLSFPLIQQEVTTVLDSETTS